MFTLKNITVSFFYYIISALGISLTIKAEIGVSSFNSLNLALATVLAIKVGTVTVAINLGFLLLCWWLDDTRSIQNYGIMTAALICFGYVINFFFYTILQPLFLHGYVIRLFIFILGTVIAGFGTGKVLKYSLLKFPIETFCLLLAQRRKGAFSFYRYGIDLICVGLSLLLSMTFHLPIYIREGTVISLLLLSSIINWSKKTG